MKKSKCCSAIAHKQEAGNYFCSHCISICNIKYDLKPIFNLVLMLMLISIITSCKAPSIRYNPKYKAVNTIDTTDVMLHQDSIFNELCKQSVLFPEYVIKSSQYETGYFTSDLCVKYNNLFGITYINSEFQDSFITVNKYKFATYKTRKDCIFDYKRLQKYYSNNIDKKYSDNKKYTTLLKNM